MSVLFEEVPPWAQFAITLVIAVPMVIVGTSMYRKQKLDGQCHIAAVEWESLNHNNAAFKAPDKSHFKKQYASYREACLNGHALVDESMIPAEVKATYTPIKN